MAIDPSVNITRAAELYNQAQRTGIAPDSIPPQDGKQPGEGSFSSMVSSYLNSAQEMGRASEEMAMKGATGQANLSDVVTAVSEAEVTLQTVVAVRDKVVDAYKEILRMPI